MLLRWLRHVERERDLPARPHEINTFVAARTRTHTHTHARTRTHAHAHARSLAHTRTHARTRYGSPTDSCPADAYCPTASIAPTPCPENTWAPPLSTKVSTHHDIYLFICPPCWLSIDSLSPSLLSLSHPANTWAPLSLKVARPHARTPHPHPHARARARTHPHPHPHKIQTHAARRTERRSKAGGSPLCEPRRSCDISREIHRMLQYTMCNV